MTFSALCSVLHVYVRRNQLDVSDWLPLGALCDPDLSTRDEIGRVSTGQKLSIPACGIGSRGSRFSDAKKENAYLSSPSMQAQNNCRLRYLTFADASAMRCWRRDGRHDAARTGMHMADPLPSKHPLIFKSMAQSWLVAWACHVMLPANSKGRAAMLKK